MPASHSSFLLWNDLNTQEGGLGTYILFYLFQVITDQFRLSTKELLSCELQVLVLLEFALKLSLNEVTPIYKRLVTVNM